MIRRLG